MGAQPSPCLPWPLPHSLMGFFLSTLFRSLGNKDLAFSNLPFKQFPAKWVCSRALCRHAQPPVVRGTAAMSQSPALHRPSSPVGLFQFFFQNVFLLLRCGSKHCTETQIPVSYLEGNRDIFFITPRLIGSMAVVKELICCKICEDQSRTKLMWATMLPPQAKKYSKA